MIDTIPAANQGLAGAAYVISDAQPRLEITLVGWEIPRLLRPDDLARKVWQRIRELWFGKLLVRVTQPEIQRRAR